MFSYTFSAAGFRNQIISAFDGREQQTLKYLFDEELASSCEDVGYREADSYGCGSLGRRGKLA